MFIKTDGSLWSVGRNHEGQLGDGTTTDRSTPASINTDVTAVSGGVAHTLFIKTGGTLWGCGQNTFFQLGSSLSSPRPTPVQITTGVTAVAAGASHSLFIKTDATAWAMGYNFFGNFGTGSSNIATSPTQIATGIAAVAAGLNHSVFLKTDGTVRGAGDNRQRQLGGTSSAPILTSLQLAAAASAISARHDHSVWITPDGTLHGLGNNTTAQLGNPASSITTPDALPPEVVALSAGIGHTLLLHADGTLWSVGDNTYGQLGTGDTTPRTTPVQIATSVTAAAAGSWHSLFLKTDGTLWAFGRNDRGQLGDTTTTQRTAPVQVAPGVTAIAAGGAHSLFTRTGGALFAMGDNTYRQLGPFNFSTFSPNPTPGQIATGVSSFAAGSAHSFWVVGGELRAAGNNDFGQLGTGTTFIYPPSSSTIVVASDVAKVATAYAHTLFLKTDGSLWATGANASGQLGDGTTTDRLSPVPVATDVAGIAVGGLGFGVGRGHSLFFKTDGSLHAMGDNRFGQLGDGTRLDRTTPTPVPSAAFVTSVHGGDTLSAFVQNAPVAPAIADQTASQEIEYGAHAVLRVSATGGFLAHQWFEGQSGDTSRPVNGATSTHLLTLPLTETASYWVRVTNSVGSIDGATITLTPRAPLDAMLSGGGHRADGEFGEGTGLFSPRLPAPLAPDLADVAASADHALLLRTDGTLWAVGNNIYGQLGTGDTLRRSTPVQIASGVASIAVGFGHSLFLKTDGTLWATGLNSSGQLGLGNTTSRSTPAQMTSGVASIAAGSHHSLFRKTDDSLWAMGANSSGRLGDGTTTARSTPILVSAATLACAAGSSHTVFLTLDGTLRATGLNSSGQLGLGDTTSRSTPVTVATGVTALAAGDSHTVFIQSDGSLRGMGLNTSGQLGLGDFANRTTPALLASGIAAVTAAGQHSLWIDASGSLWSTGQNTRGQLGTGDTLAYSVPQEIAPRVARARATQSGAFFITTEGDRHGMGRTFANAADPEASPHHASAQHIASGVRGIATQPFTSFLVRTAQDQLAQPSSPSFALLPDTDEVARILPHRVLMQAGGSGETAGTAPRRVLFLRNDGSLWGQGDNSSGQLGTGDTLPRSEPVRIAENVADAAQTLSNTYFLRPDLSLWRVGAPLRVPVNYIPVPADLSPVRLDEHVVALETSSQHALYLKTDGTLWGVGENQHSQLIFNNNIPTDERRAPVQIDSQVAAFAASQRNTLYIKTDGTLWGRGNNSFGQLGSNTGFNLPSFQIATDVARIFPTAEATFILKTDGTLWASGSNPHGQLGLGLAHPVLGFTQVRAHPSQPFIDIARVVPAASGENTFVLKNDGSLWGMGRNDLGQLGLGHTNIVARPTLLRAQAHDVSASGLHTLVLHEPVAVAPPVITTQPTDTTVAFGDFASLSVAATSEAILSHQWYRGASGDTSSPVAGANDATLRLSAFATTATYWVRVTNLAGSADSAAATITIQGSGTPAFRAWAEAAGLRGSRLATTADADGDGQPNLLEFAFGTAPDQAAPPSLDSVLITDDLGTQLVLTHRRNKSAGVTVIYQHSSDLLTWENIALAPVVIDPDPDGDGLAEEVSVGLPLDPASPAHFLRINVSEP